MAKSKMTTKAPVKTDTGPSAADRLQNLLHGMTSTVTDDKNRERTHQLRLALIESATRIVVTATVPDACATAMGYLNHHYAADLPSPAPVSADPIVPEADAPAE